MQCPVCSEDIDASGGRIQLTRHIRNIHGYALKDADRLSRSAVAPTASDTHAELAALRDEVRRLREAGDALASAAGAVLATRLTDYEMHGKLKALNSTYGEYRRATLKGGDAQP